MPQSSSLGRQIRHSRATVSGFLCSLLPNTYFGWELQLGSRWESEAFSLALSELAQKLQHGCLCSGKLASPASAGLIHPSFKTHLHTFPCFQIWQVWMTAVTWCVSAGKITLANGIFPLKKKKKQLFFLKELSVPILQSLPVLRTEHSYPWVILSLSLGSLNTDLCWSSAWFGSMHTSLILDLFPAKTAFSGLWSVYATAYCSWHLSVNSASPR